MNNKYCFSCGFPNVSLANFCSKCGHRFGDVSSANKESISKKSTSSSQPVDDEELTDVHMSYIKEHYKAIAPLDLAKRLFPKKDITIKSKEALKISEYTKMLKRSGGTGGDRIVGAEPEEDDEEGGGESLQEMPDISDLGGLQVEIAPPPSSKISMARLIEEAKAQQGGA